MKNLILLIILVFKTLTIFSQSNWEYFNQNNSEEERIISVEEVNKDTLITASNVLHVKGDENKAKGIIRYISNKTGEVLAEKEYKIDSLGTKFEKIFYNKKSHTFVIVGSAFYENESYKRGYFLITSWNSKINLLKDTIIRIEPENENNYLWYMDGDFTFEGDILLLGIITDDLENINQNRKYLFLLLSKDGKIKKIRYYKPNVTFEGINSSLIENFDNNGYMFIGQESKIMNNNFEIIDSIITWDSKYMLLYNYNAKKISNSKFLINIAFDGWGESYNKGIAYYDYKFNLIKKAKISIKNYNVDFPIARRNFDYIDTSIIYAGCQEGNFKNFTLAKFNSNLNAYWIKYFGDDGKGRMLWNITATSDGGVILSGSKGKYREYLLPENQGAWMQKFDSDGNTVSTIEPTSNAWSITVYPNPSSGEFSINIESKAQNTKLELYDIQGKIVKRFPSLIQGKNRLYMYDIPHGIYVWQLSRAGKILGTGKWVKE